jgi:hypothetical protein
MKIEGSYCDIMLFDRVCLMFLYKQLPAVLEGIVKCRKRF